MGCIDRRLVASLTRQALQILRKLFQFVAADGFLIEQDPGELFDDPGVHPVS